MDIEGLKRTAKDITSFSAKALLVYEMTQVGGQVQTLEAADISTPQDSVQLLQYETLQTTESIGFKAQFLEIPAFNVSDPSSDAEQIAAQDTLSAWVKITEQAASDSGFLPTDFEGTIKSVVQNGKTYNVSETSLLKDVPITIKDSSKTIKKNSLLVPYLTNNGLSIAIMSDTDGEGNETTVGSYIATVGDKTIAIPARFDKNNNPISFMEFGADANGEVQPQEVALSQAVISSDQTNVRDMQDPTKIVGQIEKGAQITLIGYDTKPVKGKNFQVSLAVTPEGSVVNVATTLYEKVNNTGTDSAEKVSNINNLPIVEGKYVGEPVEGAIDLNVSAFVSGRNKNGNPTKLTLDGVEYPIMNAIAKVGFVKENQEVYGYNISASAYYLGVLGKRTITNLDISDDLKNIITSSAVPDEQKQTLLDNYSIESLEVMDYLALTRNKQGAWVKEVFSLTSPQSNSIYTRSNQPFQFTPTEKIASDLRPGRVIGTYAMKINNMPWVIDNYIKTRGVQNFPIELENSIPQIQTLSYSNLTENLDSLASGGAQIVVVGFCNVTII